MSNHHLQTSFVVGTCCSLLAVFAYSKTDAQNRLLCPQMPQTLSGAPTNGKSLNLIGILAVTPTGPTPYRQYLEVCRDCIFDKVFSDATTALRLVLTEAANHEYAFCIRDRDPTTKKEYYRPTTLRHESLRMLSLMPPRGIAFYKNKLELKAKSMLQQAKKNYDIDLFRRLAEIYPTARSAEQANASLTAHVFCQANPLMRAVAFSHINARITPVKIIGIVTGILDKNAQPKVQGQNRVYIQVPKLTKLWLKQGKQKRAINWNKVRAGLHVDCDLQAPIQLTDPLLAFAQSVTFSVEKDRFN